jgi:hypothetical protein
VWCVGVHGVLNAACGMCVRIVSRVLCTACSGYPVCVGGLSCAQWLSGVTYRVWGVVDSVYSVYSVWCVHRVPCAVQGEQGVCVHRVSGAVQCEQCVCVHRVPCAVQCEQGVCVHRVSCAVQGEQCVCVHRVSGAVQCEQYVCVHRVSGAVQCEQWVLVEFQGYTQGGHERRKHRNNEEG